MAVAFQRFDELPAELRARIWEHSLYNEYNELDGSDRTVELYNYDRASSVSFAISRRYPCLFSINREARYEGAKLDGGEWTPIYLRNSEHEDYATDVALELSINFRRDTIFLSERFIDVSATLIWNRFGASVQQYRLQWLTSLLDHSTLQKIQNLQLSVCRPSEALRLKNDAWWRGEGLDLFAPGVLKTVAILTTADDLSLWTKGVVRDNLENIWGSDEDIGELPLVQAYVLPEDGSMTRYYVSGKIIDRNGFIELPRERGVNMNGILRTVVNRQRC
jgi:hypothetical protein